MAEFSAVKQHRMRLSEEGQHLGLSQPIGAQRFSEEKPTLATRSACTRHYRAEWASEISRTVKQFSVHRACTCTGLTAKGYKSRSSKCQYTCHQHWRYFGNWFTGITNRSNRDGVQEIKPSYVTRSTEEAWSPRWNCSSCKRWLYVFMLHPTVGANAAVKFLAKYDWDLTLQTGASQGCVALLARE